ncbi:nuclear apoptosis-inducing factor 1-like [Seriola aureovittata]|uniref:nuclear apoptosis-inducing factor 1-like n=1 Tax=Seriola aureovittata TaxID=2871759 RepID=UPI0024BDAF38|nr:nuclear apoptosis-inducing factor 1-like [Seriola aureovittata]
MERRVTGKKRNFSEMEIDILTSEVAQNKDVLFVSLKSGITGAHKTAVWKRETEAVNSVAIEERTPAEVKKKWSDLKLATKKRVTALKRNIRQTGGGQPDSSLILTGTEEKIASLIGSESISGISGGGDTDALASEPEQNEPGTSGMSARSPPQTGPTAAKSERVPSAPRAAPRPNIVTACIYLLTSVVGALEAINNTLKEINDTLKKP